MTTRACHTFIVIHCYSCHIKNVDDNDTYNDIHDPIYRFIGPAFDRHHQAAFVTYTVYDCHVLRMYLSVTHRDKNMEDVVGGKPKYE